MGNDKKISHANYIKSNNKGYSGISKNKRQFKEKKNSTNIEQDGIIIEANGNGNYKIQLDNQVEIRGVLSGRMKQMNIRILVGDKVKVELSPYNLYLGGIVYRYNVQK